MQCKGGRGDYYNQENQRRLLELSRRRRGRCSYCEIVLTPLRLKVNLVLIVSHRVAEVAREHGWHPPKSLDLDENFKAEHTLFCKICRDLRTFWRSLGKTSAFLMGQKQCFLGKKCTITWYILHISLS